MTAANTSIWSAEAILGNLKFEESFEQRKKQTKRKLSRQAPDLSDLACLGNGRVHSEIWKI
ncbi:uncharacterized protein N7479_000521 [Penicillium vulpinum]|uniref:uncharacterized protein n=1 Tax=Penicillium vulpinum TaxID=29845 RepID=UPI0025497236|nr:uncharacterized protein N7479_000521 [Penicillium vulpinum]KAJ5970603.1 hypothetical protein N7479_000521 [Penicillium vulpinum]